jgi:CubicO group peptidase (beta-lactamase class C family)
MRKTVLVLLTGILALLLARPADAAPSAPGNPSNPADVASAFAKLPAELAAAHIPGAAVVVVAGGKQVFASGYGVANIATQAKIDPARTGFLINSVGKSFTATAVLQLVAQGKLDLHADVNRYLTKFKIPDTFPGKPITLFNLLTHTAGFEDQVYGVFTAKDAPLPNLADHLAGDIPKRVTPPGDYTSYSNYGYALAGYLVQLASGMPYADYIQQHIFNPLGMSNSTAVEPTPKAIDADLATGYRWKKSQQVIPPADYGPEPPAGDGNVATADDMGRYLISELQGTNTQTQFTNDPRLPGMGFGFSEHQMNGQRMLSKNGNSQGFASDTELLPQHGVGIFVAFNGGAMSGDAGALGAQMLQSFMDRFYPSAVPAPKAIGGDVSGFAGSYRESRLAYDSFTKIMAMTTGITVTAEPDGSLSTVGIGDGTRQWIQTAPRLFTEKGTGQQIAFRPQSDGTNLLFLGEDSTLSYLSVGWSSSPAAQEWVVGIAFLLLLGAVFGWPLTALVRRLRGRQPHPGGARIATVVGWSTGVALLLFVAGFIWLLSDFSGFAVLMTYGHSALLSTTLLMPDIALLLAIAALVCTGLAWYKGWWRTPGRVTYTVMTLAALAFLYVASDYNLVGLPPVT